MFSNIKAARLLGWASLAVGATEIFATRWLEDQMGVDGHNTLIRTFGVREIATGVTILNQPGVNNALAASLWGRVAGDALDLAMLGAAKGKTNNPDGLATVAAAVLAITAMDVVVAARVQNDLVNTRSISTLARSRVSPTMAMPHGLPSSVKRMFVSSPD